MKHSIAITIMLLGSMMVVAQQDAQFTHYMFNTQYVNPAYVGSRKALSVTALHRSQWVSFPGAPQTQTITLHTPLHAEKLGIGLSAVNDKIGPVRNTSAYVDFAYRMKVSRRGRMSFGVKAGFNVLRSSLSELELLDEEDQEFISDLASGMQPNFGLGVYYNDPRGYIGLSMPQLLKNTFENDNGMTTTAYQQTRHFYLIMGRVFKLNDALKLIPTAHLRNTVSVPLSAEISARALFNDKVWVGGMHRSNDGLGLMAGVYINRQLEAGYSFDWSLKNQTGRYNGGSHELVLRYDFVYDYGTRVRSPRYF